MRKTAEVVLGLCEGLRRSLDRPGRRDRTVLGGCAQVTAVRNPGMAFGLGGPGAAVGLSLAGLAAVAALRRRSPLGAGLALGGGAANMLERLERGSVFDYLRFPKVPKPLNRYVYNGADLAVFLGTALLALGPSGKK